jgi:hypothetical protein
MVNEVLLLGVPWDLVTYILCLVGALIVFAVLCEMAGWDTATGFVNYSFGRVRVRYYYLFYRLDVLCAVFLISASLFCPA